MPMTQHRQQYVPDLEKMNLASTNFNNMNAGGLDMEMSNANAKNDLFLSFKNKRPAKLKVVCKDSPEYKMKRLRNTEAVRKCREKQRKKTQTMEFLLNKSLEEQSNILKALTAASEHTTLEEMKAALTQTIEKMETLEARKEYDDFKAQEEAESLVSPRAKKDKGEAATPRSPRDEVPTTPYSPSSCISPHSELMNGSLNSPHTLQSPHTLTSPHTLASPREHFRPAAQQNIQMENMHMYTVNHPGANMYLPNPMNISSQEYYNINQFDEQRRNTQPQQDGAFMGNFI
eukprot:Nk52_evm118s221 gene=Nk52_evmTU118s221